MQTITVNIHIATHMAATISGQCWFYAEVIDNDGNRLAAAYEKTIAEAFRIATDGAANVLAGR